MNKDLHAKLAWDTDNSLFADNTTIEVTLTLKMRAGLWNWVKAKADYESLTQEEEVTTLIDEKYNDAKRHGELHGNGETLP